MTEAEVIQESRMWLRDPDGEVWSEDQMRRWVQKAVRKYSEDSGIFHGSVLLFPDALGRCKYPADYIYTLSACNARHELLELISLTELRRFYSDYRTVKGLPQYIYEELNEPGYCRLCPNPGAVYTQESAYPVWESGEIDHYGIGLDRYGVSLNPERYGELYYHFRHETCGITDDGRYGEIEWFRNGEPWRSQGWADRYGTPIELVRGDYHGEMFYSRSARLEEIADKLALVYAVCAMAYAADGDWQDVNQSMALESEYRKRVSRGRVKPMVKCRMRSY